jgi:hypothetical protein
MTARPTAQELADNIKATWLRSVAPYRRELVAAEVALAAIPAVSAGPTTSAAYDAALERAAQTAIRYGASLHVVEANRLRPSFT